MGKWSIEKMKANDYMADFDSLPGFAQACATYEIRCWKEQTFTYQPDGSEKGPTIQSVCIFQSTKEGLKQNGGGQIETRSITVAMLNGQEYIASLTIHGIEFSDVTVDPNNFTKMLIFPNLIDSTELRSALSLLNKTTAFTDELTSAIVKFLKYEAAADKVDRLKQNIFYKYHTVPSLFRIALDQFNDDVKIQLLVDLISKKDQVVTPNDIETQKATFGIL